MNNFYDFNEKINFIEKHVGGQLNDSTNELKEQENLIQNSTDDFIRLLNYQNKLYLNRDKNDDYVQQLDAKQHLSVYRINNVPTTIADINYSNPIIYPEEYDPYFEYLSKKNLGSLNTLVVKTKTIVNVDSSLRDKSDTLNILNFYNLQPNSLGFKNNSNKLRINFTKADLTFKKYDKISLRGLQFYQQSFVQLNFFFNNETNNVVIDIKPNYDFEISYYNVSILISGVTNNDHNFFKNIPLNLINQYHNVSIVNFNGDNRLSFELPLTFYTPNDNDQILSSDCQITFYNLGNYPISLLNSYLPLTDLNLNGYLTIDSVYSDYFLVTLNSNISINHNINLIGEWTDEIFYTGMNIEIGLISQVVKGYQFPNNFSVVLDKTLYNVACIKMLSSEIPNLQNNILSTEINNTLLSSSITIISSNNKFYWDNLLDSTTYSITLPYGYYTFDVLKSTIESLSKQIPRSLVFQNKNLYPFNDIRVNFNVSNNISSFTSYSTFILPNCLQGCNKYDDSNNSNGNNYIIKINQQQHNLKVNDIIFITESTNYFSIRADYINDPKGHKITSVINNDFYNIILVDINLLEEDAGNTQGGFSIKITSFNSFRLRFDFQDTFGKLMGFSFSGSYSSITPYCSQTNDYTITNKQPYYLNIINLVQLYNVKISNDYLSNKFNNYGYRYILLQCQNFNYCTNPNSVPYFYKILLSGTPGSILYSTFVDAPIFINPPIRSISELIFNFVDPYGNDINFFNIDNSFTLEITSISNFPANTNLNNYTSRI